MRSTLFSPVTETQSRFQYGGGCSKPEKPSKRKELSVGGNIETKSDTTKVLQSVCLYILICTGFTFASPWLVEQLQKSPCIDKLNLVHNS